MLKIIIFIFIHLSLLHTLFLSSLFSLSPSPVFFLSLSTHLHSNNNQRPTFKCKIFGIWHTKHHYSSLIRCSKCVKILQHATVTFYIWDNTDIYAKKFYYYFYSSLSPPYSLSLFSVFFISLACVLFVSLNAPP